MSSNKKSKQNSGKTGTRAPKNKAKQQSNNKRIQAPVAFSQKQSNRAPKMETLNDGQTCRVRNRELIGPIVNSTNVFNVTNRLRVNPASANTFAWLSTIASSWESYRFRRLRFEFIGRCATTTAGSVIMSPDYDAQDGQPSTELQMGQYRGSQEDTPWSKIVLHLLPASMNRLYKSHVTMSDSRFATTTQDEKTIDAAQVFIANDVGSNLTLGKLWVDYEVDLMTPQPPTLPLPSGGANIILANTGLTTTGSTIIRSANHAFDSIQQDVTQPLLKDAYDASYPGKVVEFLRDWQGDVSVDINSSVNNAFGGAIVGYLLKQGNPLISQALTAVAGAQENTYFKTINGPDGGGFFNTARAVMNLVAQQGDVLSLGNNGQGMPFANNPGTIYNNWMLGASRFV